MQASSYTPPLRVPDIDPGVPDLLVVVLALLATVVLWAVLGGHDHIVTPGPVNVNDVAVTP